MEKARVCVFARLVWGIGEEQTVWLSARGAPLDDWPNGGYVDMYYSRVVSMIWALWGISPILRNGCRVQGQKVFRKMTSVAQWWLISKVKVRICFPWGQNI